MRRQKRRCPGTRWRRDRRSEGPRRLSRRRAAAICRCREHGTHGGDAGDRRDAEEHGARSLARGRAPCHLRTWPRGTAGWGRCRCGRRSTRVTASAGCQATSCGGGASTAPKRWSNGARVPGPNSTSGPLPAVGPASGTAPISLRPTEPIIRSCSNERPESGHGGPPHRPVGAAPPAPWAETVVILGCLGGRRADPHQMGPSSRRRGPGPSLGSRDGLDPVPGSRV